MASKNGTTETQNGGQQTQNRPKASKEELRKLFAAYDKADAEVDSLLVKVEAAKAARGRVIRQIVEGSGTKGPFRHPTTTFILTAVERKSKDGEGESTWYFKGPSQSDVVDV